MTNWEFYKDKIKEFPNFAVVQGELINCNKLSECTDCIFKNTEECRYARYQWLMEEYKPAPTITTKEKAFLSVLNAKYIARDKNDALYLYVDKPVRENATWDSDTAFRRVPDVIFDVEFPFIKWEDDEPWSVEELLKLEVCDK